MNSSHQPPCCYNKFPNIQTNCSTSRDGIPTNQRSSSSYDNKSCPRTRHYLSVEVSERRRVVGTLEHVQHPDLMRGARERQAPHVSREQDQVGGGGVVGPPAQRALVHGAPVLYEPILARPHVPLQPARQQNLLQPRPCSNRQPESCTRQPRHLLLWDTAIWTEKFCLCRTGSLEHIPTDSS